jgi:hypothetical protein
LLTFEIVLYGFKIYAGEFRELISGDKLMGLFVKMFSDLMQ